MENNYIKIVAPTHCPTCDSGLELVNDQLFCRNSSCSAKVNKQIEHYAKTMKIKGLGPKTVEKLSLESINDIYNLSEEDITDALGDKLGSKLYIEIENSKTSELSMFLAAFSIPLIGKTAAGKLANVVSNISEITFKKCKEAGLGDKASGNMLGWIVEEWEQEYKDLPVQTIRSQVVNNPSLGLSVVLTGKVEGYTRTSLKAELISLGFDVKTSVSAKTNYVLAGANKSRSSTETKADDLGIPVVNTIEELMKLTQLEN